MRYQPATMKAGIVTSCFAAFGVFGFFYTSALVPLLLLYFFLLLHTFFSIRCFSALIDVRDLRQWGIDTALVLSYAGLSLTFSSPLIFFAVFTWLFLIALFKYTLLIYRLPHPRLVQRKIYADLLGALLGVFGFLMATISFLPGYYLAAVFLGLSCVYYLLLDPLYVPDARSSR